MGSSVKTANTIRLLTLRRVLLLSVWALICFCCQEIEAPTAHECSQVFWQRAPTKIQYNSVKRWDIDGDKMESFTYKQYRIWIMPQLVLTKTSTLIRKSSMIVENWETWPFWLTASRQSTEVKRYYIALVKVHLETNANMTFWLHPPTITKPENKTQWLLYHIGHNSRWPRLQVTSQNGSTVTSHASELNSV